MKSAGRSPKRSLKCRADFPSALSNERRNVLPSIATCFSFKAKPNDRSQLCKHVRNSLVSSRENTRPKVSWEGMPLGRSRNRNSQSSLLFPNRSTSAQLLAPDIAVHNAITTMSDRR